MARILLVDDEPEIRFLTRMMLEQDGHKVVEAVDGAGCLEKLKADMPDLILLDIMMPGPDGWEICRRIKANKELRNIPVVMFTIRTSEEDMKHSMECCADAHINKPFDRKGLLSRVRGLLKK